MRARTGVLFQEGGLFDSMTIEENVSYPLINQKIDTIPPEEIHGRVEEVLQFVGLPNTLQRFPSELSGGMRRRVGIARATVTQPRLVLYDSPTAGLDPIGAAAFDELTLSLKKTLGLTVFLITHDLDSLYAICDRVAVLADKKVIAVGTIDELLKTEHPWIQEYFNGPRGRAATAAVHAHEKETA